MGCNVFDVTNPRYSDPVTGIPQNPTQAAMNDAAARGGGIVYAPAGTYVIDGVITVPFAADPVDPSFNFAPTIQFIGDGPDVTIFKRKTGGSVIHDLLHIERSFTTVSGMTFDGGDGSATQGNGIVVGQTLGGGNDGRVFRRIQVQNVIVRNCAERLLWVLGGSSPAPISILSHYLDCVFAGNKQDGSSPIYGAVTIDPRNTTQFFRGVHINKFKGNALRLDGCSGISFVEGRIDYNASALYPYAFLKDAQSCHFDATWFEEETALETLQWFIEMNQNCTGSSASGCFFKRKRNVSSAVRVGPSAPSRGILITDPHIRLPSAPAGTDTPISIENADSEVAVFGGVMEIGSDGGPFTYQALEIGDQATRSVHLAPDRRLRIPRLSASDISGFVAGNRRISDILNRDITGLRTGTGLEAFNGTNWLPMTVNRYATITDLRNNETSKDRGTLAWVDSAPGTLRVWDSTDWWTVIRRIGAYDNTGLGADPVDLLVASAPGGGFMYRLSVMVKVTTTDSATLIVKAKWNDGSGQEVQMFQLSMANANDQGNSVFAIYLASGDIRVTANAVGGGRYTLRARAEVL